MAKTIVNLTLPVILEEIDTALESNLYQTYTDILNLPNLRQFLVGYVLRRVQVRYRMIDQTDQLAIVFRSLPSCLEEHLRIAVVVHQGIHELIYQSQAAQSSVPDQPVEVCLVASR